MQNHASLMQQHWIALVGSNPAAKTGSSDFNPSYRGTKLSTAPGNSQGSPLLKWPVVCLGFHCQQAWHCHSKLHSE